MLRYRCDVGSTREARQRFHNVARLGDIFYVSGVRYRARCNYGMVTAEVVRVKGHYGTARFRGLCWGYSGEGPRGLRDLLQFIGLTSNIAETVAFDAPRQDKPGTDWEIIIGARMDAKVDVHFAGEEHPRWWLNGLVKPLPYQLLRS